VAAAAARRLFIAAAAKEGELDRRSAVPLQDALDHAVQGRRPREAVRVCDCAAAAGSWTTTTAPATAHQQRRVGRRVEKPCGGGGQGRASSLTVEARGPVVRVHAEALVEHGVVPSGVMGCDPHRRLATV
jgi:hypothetical protein